MKTDKQLGIWMDHAHAHVIEFTNDISEEKNVISKMEHEEKGQNLGKNENMMNNREKHDQSDYYKKLGEVIINYQEVILFGPTNAKAELLNVLRADHRFEKVKIDIQQTDKMTDNQQMAFVNGHFTKQ